MLSVESPLYPILQTAIQREIEAHALYRSTADRVEAPQAKALLHELATQELGHRNRLEALLHGNALRALSSTLAQRVVDLKITDYLVEAPLAPESDIQEILIVAGKREKGSHDLYAALAQVAEDADTRALFEYLAAEELTHKQRIETLYDQLIYREN